MTVCKLYMSNVPPLSRPHTTKQNKTERESKTLAVFRFPHRSWGRCRAGWYGFCPWWWRWHPVGWVQWLSWGLWSSHPLHLCPKLDPRTEHINTINIHWYVELSRQIDQRKALPAQHGTVCPLSPGNASYSLLLSAGELNTARLHSHHKKDEQYWLDYHSVPIKCVNYCSTLLNSFWYCGIFLSIWESSFMVVCKRKKKGC